MKHHELDAVDRTILNILQRDAKRPLKEIAKEVFLSTTAVSARIEKMERGIYLRVSGSGESGGSWISC